MKGMLTIRAQRKLTSRVVELTCYGELVKKMTEPGQFIHIRIDRGEDLVLRRPISICDVDIEKEELTLVYRIEGKGTARLAAKKSGETLDLLGPLGRGFPLDEAKKGETALIVGGGVGVPPLYYLSKQLIKRDVRVVHVLGFQSERDVFYEEKFRELGDTYIATVDGTKGTKGFVTDVIEKERFDFDVLYSCGPIPMLRALSEKYQNRRAYISLEERMACGIGACFACVCHADRDVKKAYRKICTDGPVFRVGEVVL